MKKKRIHIVSSLAALMAIYLMLPLHLSFLNDPYSLVVFDENQELLGALVADDEQWRFPLMEKVPRRFADALVTYEDKRFYKHPGVDVRALARAIKQNLRKKRIVSGASTLTMQLARMHFGKERTVWQKLKECVYAVKIDLLSSKDKILQYYCAHAPFGGNVVGLEAASWRYFQKSPHHLSWAESATLAALPNSPGLIHVNRNRKLLKTKRDFILRKLLNSGKIDSLEYHLGLAELLPNKVHKLPHQAPHYVNRLHAEGLKGRLNTSINFNLQERVNRIATAHHRQLAQNHIHNGGILIMDNHSDEVKAYLGNMPNTHEEKDVDMVVAKRSTGSIIKPLLYAAMLDEGQITPKTGIKDVPTIINGFMPSNYDGSFSGLVSADEVIQRSLNIPSVLMLREYGIAKFLWKLKQLNIGSINKSADHYGLTLILGGAEITLWELVSVYSKMAGELIDSKNDVHPFSDISIWQTFEAMKKLMRPDDRGEWQHYNNSREIAWKTGTSFGHRDAWAVGVTPSYTVGVWVGNADGEGRDEIIGVSTAGRLMFDVFDLLPQDESWFAEPKNQTITTDICQASGMLATDACDITVLARLDEDAVNSAQCIYHKRVHTNRMGTYQVHKDCWDDQDLTTITYFQLPPIVSKFYRNRNFTHQSLPPFHPSCLSGQEHRDEMAIVYPYPGDRIHLPKDLNGLEQELVAELVHKNSEAKVYWYLDENYLTSTNTQHKIGIRPTPGLHVLTCIDQQGNRKSVSFTILEVNADIASH